MSRRYACHDEGLTVGLVYVVLASSHSLPACSTYRQTEPVSDLERMAQPPPAALLPQML